MLYPRFYTWFFKITKVLQNLPFPRYIIKDYKGEEIVGSFFEEELVKYTSNDT